MNLEDLRHRLRASARPGDVATLQSFFKTGPGQYGEGDRFLGVKTPAIRRLVRECNGVPDASVLSLLRSPWHEERLLSLLLLVRRFEMGDERRRKQVFDFYLRQIRHINNWDLVDLSAPNIVGTWLLDRPRKVLDRLAGSRSLWKRRIAVVATHAFIRKGEFDDTLRLCERLLTDPHDLMHKACGWMLREVGKRDLGTLRRFLDIHVPSMPRTMLRYAIERFPESERLACLRRPRLAGGRSGALRLRNSGLR